MLFTILFVNILYHVVCSEGIEKQLKPYMFPVPFELPNRNDRADQCWLRIEDVELTETVSVYCYIAHAFLRNYIQEYNSKKMTEDDVDISLWIEKPRILDEVTYKPNTNQNELKDWRVSTVMDPATRMRLYVTKNADCRLIMYTREGMTNYKVDCETILYFVNDRLTGSAIFSRACHLFLSLSLFLVYLSA